MRRLFRPALVLTAVAAVALASGASAAPKPAAVTFTDPAGDNTSPSSASDITGVTFTTVGKVVSRRYVPKALVLTLRLAAPPTADGTTEYSIDSNLEGCGDFYLNYAPGAGLSDSFNYVECGGDPSDPTGSGTVIDAVPVVKGSSIVWTIPLNAFPDTLKPGATFTGLNAFTDLVDPVTGIFSASSTIGVPLYDTAETDTPFRIG